MSVILIPNQNVIFFDGQDFNARNKQCTWDARTYCQPVQYETATQFQVKTTGVTGFNLVTNGSFNIDLSGWVVGANGGWTFNSQTALLDSNSNTDKTLTQSLITTTIGEIYKICFTVSGFLGTTRDAIASAVAEDSTGTLIEDLFITQNGTFCFNFRATTATSQIVFTTMSLLTLRIDNVTMTLQSAVEVLDVTIEDCDGNFEKNVDDIVTIGDTTTITVDWTDLLAGCHRICINGIGDTSFNFLTSGTGLLQESGGLLLDEDGKEIRWI